MELPRARLTETAFSHRHRTAGGHHERVPRGRLVRLLPRWPEASLALRPAAAPLRGTTLAAPGADAMAMATGSGKSSPLRNTGPRGLGGVEIAHQVRGHFRALSRACISLKLIRSPLAGGQSLFSGSGGAFLSGTVLLRA